MTKRPPEWTPDEVDYLRAHPGRAERAAVALHLGRSVSGVTLKLSRLGLISTPGNKGGGRLPNYADGLRGRHRPHPSMPAAARLARPEWFADEGHDDSRDLAARMTAGR